MPFVVFDLVMAISLASPSHLPLISLAPCRNPNLNLNSPDLPSLLDSSCNDDVVQAICIIDSAIMGTVRASGSSCEEVNGEGCARRSGTWEPLSM